MLTTTPFFEPARRLRAEADDVEPAVGRDLGDDRDDLRRADVEADDEILVVLHVPLSCFLMALARPVPRAVRDRRSKATIGHDTFRGGFHGIPASRGEAVAIAQIDVIDALARRARATPTVRAYAATKRASRAVDVVAAERRASTRRCRRASQLPAAARATGAGRATASAERREQLRPLAIALRPSAATVRPGPLNCGSSPS